MRQLVSIPSRSVKLRVAPFYPPNLKRFQVSCCSEFITHKMAAKIWETPEWATLKAHAENDISKSHLRELMQVNDWHIQVHDSTSQYAVL